MRVTNTYIITPLAVKDEEKNLLNYLWQEDFDQGGLFCDYLRESAPKVEYVDCDHLDDVGYTIVYLSGNVGNRKDVIEKYLVSCAHK